MQHLGAGFTLGFQDVGLLISLSSVDFGLLLTFRIQDLGLLLTFGLQDFGTTVTLSLHLEFHGTTDAFRRSNILQFNAVDLNTPFIGGIVKHIAQLRVDGIARGQGFVQLHFADHVTQCGLREFFNSHGQVLDFVDGLHRVDDLEVKQGVDFGHHIILGDDALFVEIVHLLTHVDARGTGDAAVLPTDDGFLGLLDDGQDDIDASVQGAVVLAETLDNHRFRLGNDLDSTQDVKHYENH